MPITRRKASGFIAAGALIGPFANAIAQLNRAEVARWHKLIREQKISLD